MAEVFIDSTPYNVYAGDAWSQPFEFGEYTTEGDEGSWVAEDLSALSSWSSQWRPTAESPDEDAIDLTVDATDAANGVLVVAASAAQTRAMGDSGVFDIQSAAPAVRTMIRAKTKWRLDVTR
jgi:hypothetical protein